MRLLEGYSIAFVAEERSNVLRAEGLRHAGANVRVCLPQLDLWTTLGDGFYDVLVLLASEAEPSVNLIAAALEDDPRTRELPVLVLVHPALAHALVRDAGGRSVVTLSAAAPDESLARAVLNLALPRRRLLEAHHQQRLYHEQLRALARRTDDAQVDHEKFQHDIRALLGIAFGFACNLRDEIAGPLSQEQAEYVARIAEATRGATALLDRTRGMGRVTDELKTSSAPPPPARAGGAQRSRVDLALLAESVARLFEPSALAQSKSLTCRCEHIFVWGDVLKLRQLLTNLIANALKYSPSGGTISVAVRFAPGEGGDGPSARRKVEIVVSNSGCSIARAYRERIFESGFRLAEHTHLPGEGIGLSIVQEVVVQHGGEIRVDDQSEEGGTSFIVTLPSDLRVRDQHFGVLLAPDVDPSTRLVEAIRAQDPAELRAILASTPNDFLRMAAACGAAIVVPRDKTRAFSEEIARLVMPAAPSTMGEE
jgi:signal transduction histidine kinase